MKAEIRGTNSYNILCVDSGNNTIFEFDQEGNVVNTVPTHGTAFEIWKLRSNYLYPHFGPEYNGVCLTDMNGNKLMDYKSDNEIFTCQPIENDYVLVGELTQKRLVLIDLQGAIQKIIPVQSEVSGHEVMRMARRQKDGSYLVVHPGDARIRQYDENGAVIREVATHPDTFAAHILASSNIVYTSQTAIVEVDTSGKTVWEANADDLRGISPQWLTGLEVLESGNYLVCNWLGHGREGMGAPLFEIDHHKKIIWQLRAPDFTKNLANAKVLSAQ